MNVTSYEVVVYYPVSRCTQNQLFCSAFVSKESQPPVHSLESNSCSPTSEPRQEGSLLWDCTKQTSMSNYLSLFCFFPKNLIYFYVDGCFPCVCLCTMCLKRTEEGIRSLGTGVTDAWLATTKGLEIGHSGTAVSASSHLPSINSITLIESSKTLYSLI